MIFFFFSLAASSFSTLYMTWLKRRSNSYLKWQKKSCISAQVKNCLQIAGIKKEPNWSQLWHLVVCEMDLWGKQVLIIEHFFWTWWVILALWLLWEALLVQRLCWSQPKHNAPILERKKWKHQAWFRLLNPPNGCSFHKQVLLSVYYYYYL